MRTRFLIAACVIAAAAIAAGGCILAPRSTSSERLSAANPLADRQASPARPDSMPPHPPPPSPPSNQPTISVLFAGADSVAAGQTSVTRWSFGNPGRSSITVAWNLVDEQGWPGFPKQGTIDLAPLGSQLLEVAVAVPDSTAPGFYALHMTATARNRTATADGGVPVFGDSIPPDTLGARAR